MPVYPSVMISALSYDALKALKMKLEEENIELREESVRLDRELVDLLFAAKEKTARIEKKNNEIEAEIARILHHLEVFQTRRAAKMSRSRRHSHQTEQLPRLELEALRERLRLRLEMREKQRATLEKLNDTLTEKLQKNKEDYSSLPYAHVARLVQNELQKQDEGLKELVRMKDELLSFKNIQVAKYRKDNRHGTLGLNSAIELARFGKLGKKQKR